MRRDATISDKCVTLFFDDDKDDEEDHELDIMHVVARTPDLGSIFPQHLKMLARAPILQRVFSGVGKS